MVRRTRAVRCRLPRSGPVLIEPHVRRVAGIRYLVIAYAADRQPWMVQLGNTGIAIVAEQFRVQIVALILPRLVDLDRDAVGVGPSILSDPSHLP